MKRTKLLIIVIILASIAAAAAFLDYASLNGSIVKRIQTTRQVKAYVEENFPGEPYDVSFSRYDFKGGGYFCIVQSRESADTRFTVFDTKDGMADDFDNMVTCRHNTLLRLENSLDTYAEHLMGEVYPYRTELVLAMVCGDARDEAVQALPLDMEFDIDTFPLPVTLTVWTETQQDKPSWEEAEERLRELDALVRERFPGIRYYSLCLQDKYAADEGGEPRAVDYFAQVCVYDVPAEVVRGAELKDWLAAERAAQEAEQAAVAGGEEPVKPIE